MTRILLSGLLLSCVGWLQPIHGQMRDRVTGWVVSEAGAPLVGAVVSIVGSEDMGVVAQTVSGDSGRFDFDSLGPLEAFYIIASADNFLTSGPYSVNENDRLIISLKRIPEGASSSILVNPDPSGLSVFGRVTDRASGRPLEDAVVLLDGAVRAALSDASGRFRFPKPDVGVLPLTVRRFGYREVTGMLDTSGEATVYVDVTLDPDAISLDPIVASVVSPRQSRRAAEVVHRIRLGTGSVLASDELAVRGFPMVQEALRAVPGVEVRPSGAPVFRRSASLGGCIPTFWIDGIKIRDWVTAIRVNSRDIDVIEIYKGPATTPAEYLDSDSQCGVVVIWTLRGEAVSLTDLIRSQGG